MFYFFDDSDQIADSHNYAMIFVGGKNFILECFQYLGYLHPTNLSVVEYCLTNSIIYDIFL